MSAPDLEQIAEVILLSEGYKSAEELGRKVVSLYSLSRELLSPQQHYDWGLRALKTVLRASGHLLQMRRQQNSAIDVDAETQLVVQAARVNTRSKLTYGDSIRSAACESPDVFLITSALMRLSRTCFRTWICRRSNTSNYPMPSRKYTQS